jgi:hypothetical protein
LIVATSIQWKLLDLALVNQTGGLLCRYVDHRGCIFDCDLLLDGVDGQLKVNLLTLPDRERNSYPSLRGKTWMLS